ncbi:hypothetical protein KAH81_08995 [bacterium]|nr:hypothetical protein [bacterium]
MIEQIQNINRHCEEHSDVAISSKCNEIATLLTVGTRRLAVARNDSASGGNKISVGAYCIRPSDGGNGRTGILACSAWTDRDVRPTGLLGEMQ